MLSASTTMRRGRTKQFSSFSLWHSWQKIWDLHCVRFSVDLNFIAFKASAILSLSDFIFFFSIKIVSFRFWHSERMKWVKVYTENERQSKKRYETRKNPRLKINPCEIVNHLRAFSLRIYGQFFFVVPLTRTIRHHGMSALWFRFKTPVFWRFFRWRLWTPLMI